MTFVFLNVTQELEFGELAFEDRLSLSLKLTKALEPVSQPACCKKSCRLAVDFGRSGLFL